MPQSRIPQEKRARTLFFERGELGAIACVRDTSVERDPQYPGKVLDALAQPAKTILQREQSTPLERGIAPHPGCVEPDHLCLGSDGTPESSDNSGPDKLVVSELSKVTSESGVHSLLF